MTEQAPAEKTPDKRGYHPHSAFMKAVTVGDHLVFDTFYGIETVTKVTPMADQHPPGFLYAETVIVFEFDRRNLITGETFTARAIRASNEPATIWRQEDKLPDDIRERLAALRAEIEELVVPSQ